VSTIVIEELEGRRRTLTLVGPALPLRGATWGGEQRLVTTFPPGKGGEATQQVLGAIEEPSEWEGVWNTTRMVAAPSILRSNGQDQQITRAFTLMSTFEDIARSGALLRVTWATENRKISREGRVGTYKFPVDREDDIRWNASFVWTSRGSGNDTAPAAQASEDVEASVRAMNRALTDLQSAIVGASVQSVDPNVPSSPSFVTLGQLEQLANVPKTFIEGVSNTAARLRTTVSRTVSVIEAARNQPAEVAQVAGTAARETSAELLAVQKRMGRIPPETLTDAGAPASGVARNAAYFALVAGKNDVVLMRALETEAAARKRVRAAEAARGVDQTRAQDVVTTVYARAGDTFAKLAARYYGTADLAAALARANGLPPYQVSPVVGSQVIVPRLGAADGPSRG
jgi:hypothetical protein